MKIKAIVFDKDGTLVDFETYWREVATYAAGIIFPELGIEAPNIKEHLCEMGLSDDGVDISGALPRGDHALMATLIYEFAKRYGSPCTFDEAVRAFARGYGKGAKEQGTVRSTAKRLPALIEKLKSLGVKTALITSDEASGAEVCLKRLGILSYFDTVLAYDGVTPAKPDPAFMNRFCLLHSVSPGEVIMVGDTETDMLFAKNSGAFALGLATSDKNKNILLSAGADAVISDLWQIFDFL